VLGIGKVFAKALTNSRDQYNFRRIRIAWDRGHN